MARKKTKYPLVYLEWVDASHDTENWITVEEAVKRANKEDLRLIKQTGFLIKECKKYTIIAQRVNEFYDGETEDEVDGVITIPKTWIRKRINIQRYIK